MPIYIEDSETTRLLEEFAQMQNKNKTAALRDLLRTEVNRKKKTKTPEERFRAMQAVIDTLPAKRKRVKREDIESLYEYLRGS